MSNSTYKVCSQCGAHLVRRENVMTTSHPSLYIYDCPECGKVEYDIHMYPCGDDACNLVHSEIVDYKEKYEATLQTAKQWIADGCTDKEKIALEAVFPELRESKDEKIREQIEQALIEHDWSVVYRVSKEDCLAWLEKQKEQKYDECDFTIYHPLKNGKGEYECIPYSFYGSLTSFSEDKDLIDFLRTCFYTEEECNEWIEQQKEQKQEWSKEDEEMLNKLINRLNTVQLLARTDSTSLNFSFFQEIGWLKSLRNRAIRKPSKEQMGDAPIVYNNDKTNKF